MTEKWLKTIELIDESTIKLSIKYLNGDNIYLKITKKDDLCSISDEAGLFNALSDKAKANFASFVDNWRIEFGEIKLAENNALVFETRNEFVVGDIGSLVSAILMINDFAERGEYRRDYFFVD